MSKGKRMRKAARGENLRYSQTGGGAPPGFVLTREGEDVPLAPDSVIDLGAESVRWR